MPSTSSRRPPPAGYRSTRGEWVRRYQRRSDEERPPKGKEARRELADQIGRDGIELLNSIAAAEAPSWLREVPAAETLRRSWVQNYLQAEAGVRLRTAEDGLPPRSSSDRPTTPAPTADGEVTPQVQADLEQKG